MNKLLPLIITLVVLCASCTTTKYVPVQVETIKEQVHTQFVADTIHITDSVIIDRGTDTLRIERWRTQYKSIVLRDTVIVNDTIREPQIVEVEAKLTTWQNTKLNYGGWAMALLALVLILIIRVWKR